MVHRVTAKEPKRSPSRGHLFIHRSICLFSLTQNEKSNNITESIKQNRTSQIMYTLYSIYTLIKKNVGSVSFGEEGYLLILLLELNIVESC